MLASLFSPSSPTRQSLAPAPEVQRLLITRQLWSEIEGQCSHDGLETGGKALGRVYTDGTAIACLHIGPGPRAQRTRASFRPDIGYQQACYDGLLSRYPLARLTLDYHLHPDGPAGLSTTDHHTIQEMLGPSGCGLTGLTFMVLTRTRQGLRPHAFHARRRNQQGELDLHPVEVGFIADDDPRVEQLFASAPTDVKVIIPREVCTQLAHRLDEARAETLDPASGSEPVRLTGKVAHAPNIPHSATEITLYGYQRLDEGVILVLSTAPFLDAYPIGRAVLDGSMPLREHELRLTFQQGALQAVFQHAGVSIPCQLEQPVLQADLPRRNQGLVEEAELARKHVALVGLGSVGAPIAIALAQAGAGRFSLLDPDRFSVPNVARHPGDLRDLGRRKDTLLREKLLARNPNLEVSCLDEDVRDHSAQERLNTELGDVDLLIISTDDPTANLAANRLAITLQVPALFVGVYEEGLGGELFVLRPAIPGCYACVAGFRAQLPPVPRVERAHDYLNLRPGAELPPMNALGIDISHTVSLAASAALGLLGVKERLSGLLTPEEPLLLVANGRPGWIFTRPFELVPVRLAEPGCPVCRTTACCVTVSRPHTTLTAPSWSPLEPESVVELDGAPIPPSAAETLIEHLEIESLPGASDIDSAEDDVLLPWEQLIARTTPAASPRANDLLLRHVACTAPSDGTLNTDELEAEALPADEWLTTANRHSDGRDSGSGQPDDGQPDDGQPDDGLEGVLEAMLDGRDA